MVYKLRGREREISWCCAVMLLHSKLKKRRWSMMHGWCTDEWKREQEHSKAIHELLRICWRSICSCYICHFHTFIAFAIFIASFHFIWLHDNSNIFSICVRAGLNVPFGAFLFTRHFFLLLFNTKPLLDQFHITMLRFTHKTHTEKQTQAHDNRFSIYSILFIHWFSCQRKLLCQSVCVCVCTQIDVYFTLSLFGVIFFSWILSADEMHWLLL